MQSITSLVYQEDVPHPHGETQDELPSHARLVDSGYGKMDIVNYLDGNKEVYHSH